MFFNFKRFFNFWYFLIFFLFLINFFFFINLINIRIIWSKCILCSLLLPWWIFSCFYSSCNIGGMRHKIIGFIIYIILDYCILIQIWLIKWFMLCRFILFIIYLLFKKTILFLTKYRVFQLLLFHVLIQCQILILILI